MQGTIAVLLLVLQVRTKVVVHGRSFCHVMRAKLRLQRSDCMFALDCSITNRLAANDIFYTWTIYTYVTSEDEYKTRITHF